MILWNEKIKKSEEIMRAVINQLLKENINTDGVVEIFNDGIEQGCVLKLFDKYNPNLDLCFWIYLPENRQINNEINVIVGKHINCNKINMWDGDDIKLFSFSDSASKEMHKKTRDFLIDTIKQNLYKTHDIPRL